MIEDEPKIRYSQATGEVEVAASRVALLRFADLLESGSGYISARRVVNPAPYEKGLVGISVIPAVIGKVIFRVESEAGLLVVEGGRSEISILAENIRGLAMDGHSDEHMHIEYFPDHFYLGESTLPIVFRVT